MVCRTYKTEICGGELWHWSDRLEVCLSAVKQKGLRSLYSTEALENMEAVLQCLKKQSEAEGQFGAVVTGQSLAA